MMPCIRALPVMLCVLLWTATRAAAVDDCPNCILGIWDDEHLTRNYGYSAPNTVKIIYVGMRDPNPSDLFTNVEFSIAGLRREDGMFVLAVSCSQGAVPSCIGPVASPADTSVTSAATGGLVTNWFDCFGGGQALISVALLHVEPRSDHVLQVKHKYPTSNAAWHTPAAFRCGAARTPVRVSDGCYVLNPTPGYAGPCPLENVPVASSTWTRVKSLYR